MPKKPRPIVTDVQRLQQFFAFCDGLEAHAFFKAHRGGGPFRLDTSFPEDGNDTSTLNFDETHLESYLARLRQFLFEGELFFFKDIRRSIVTLFGEDAEFTSFYDKLVASIQRPMRAGVVISYKKNGQAAVVGHSLPELLQAYLYTGPLHSERVVHQEPGSAEDGLPGSHEATRKHLVLHLAGASIPCTTNAMALRNWALRRARDVKKTDAFSELAAFDARSRLAGC